MAKAPSEWCSEDHLDVLEERGQRTEDQRTQEVESALCYELCANNGVKVTPGREVGECSPSPYSHLKLTPQPLKPLYSVTHQVSLIPLNSQASLHFLMDQPPLITGAGVGGKSQGAARQGLSCRAARDQEDSWGHTNSVSVRASAKGDSSMFHNWQAVLSLLGSLTSQG